MKIVQAYNPRTKQWIKIDRTKGQILAVKKTEGKFKGIPVFKKRK
jgi:hypothetical protein